MTRQALQALDVGRYAQALDVGPAGAPGARR